MNKLSLYVLIVVAVVAVVVAQNPPTPPSATTDQATAQATPTAPPVADITPTPDMSATPQVSTTPLPSTTPDASAAATATPDMGAAAQPTPTVQVITPEVAPTPLPTATPAAVAVATATPQIQISNRKDLSTAPTDSDMYCSGFISHRLPSDTYVVGGQGSPQQSRFQGGDVIYLHGPTLPTGSKVLLLRHVSDPMIETEAYPGQKKLGNKYGDVYQELGIATINGTMNHVMTASFNLVCDPVVPADIAIPLPDRVRPTFRPPSVFSEHLSEPNGKLTGRIIFANEFDWVIGQGSRVYLNLGGDQLKPGDYLKITRTYSASLQDPLDSLEFKNNTDEPSRKQSSSNLHRAIIGKQDQLPAFDAKRQVGSFPRQTLGELMVLYTTPTTATAIVTNAEQSVYIGDMVELEDPQAETTPTPIASVQIPSNSSSASAGMNPPVINCQAQSATVHAGQAASVVCTATSPDNHPVTVSFEANRGRLQIQDRSATVDTRGLDPGPLSVKATATDDRNLSTSASTLVNVDSPVAAEAVPTPSKVADLNFKRNSSYVDNRSKAALDDIALRLQKDPSSTAVVVGSNATGEPSTLAEQRAKNAGTYLTKDKGIGTDRIQSQSGAAGASGAAVWIVPPGANMPTDTNTTTPVNTNPSDTSTPNSNPTDNSTPINNNPGATNTPDSNNTAPVDPGQIVPHRVIGPPENR